jgi:hypothetical protein
VASEFTEGGGGKTFGPSEWDAVLEPVAFTEGGGGTTSLGPKIFPMMLLMNDPLAAVVGGGGTTACEGSGAAPVGMRRRSPDVVAVGGGATTVGAGMFSLAVREVTRCGAETGGGTILVSVSRTGALETSRLTAVGAGGTTLGASI